MERESDLVKSLNQKNTLRTRITLCSIIFEKHYPFKPYIKP